MVRVKHKNTLTKIKITVYVCRNAQGPNILSVLGFLSMGR